MLKIKSFAHAREVLEAYWPTHFNLHRHTLEHMERFMAFLGNPQNQLKVVHVAGTSGKTSTAYYAAALLHAAGKRVGLTVSPHVDEINERIQINLEPLDEKTYCAELTIFLELAKESGEQPNYFELLFAFACWEFVRQRVEYAVIEVGIGGLLDATNVVNREDKVCVITDIGFDHTRLLGNTLGEIATQKAGIIHFHNAVFCYRQAPEIMDPVRLAAKQKEADLHILASEPHHQFPFLPLFQRRNLRLAQEVVNGVLQREDAKTLTDDMVERAAHTYIPARMEMVRRGDKTIIMDGAHNDQKLHALRKSVHDLFGKKQVAVLVSVLGGKEPRLDEIAKELVALGDHLIFTTFGGSRDGPKHSMADLQDLIAACRRQGAANSTEFIPDSQQALQALLARPEPVLIATGSFYVLNHVRPTIQQG